LYGQLGDERPFRWMHRAKNLGIGIVKRFARIRVMAVNAIRYRPLLIICADEAASGGILGAALGTSFGEELSALVLTAGKRGKGALRRVARHQADDEYGLVIGRCLENLSATRQYRIIQMRR
jgi:hypothetical protein